MTYSIVMATRNRRSALAVSIPLMLRQSVPPSQFILVDSSDDHRSVVRAVEAIAAGSGANTALSILESRPGTALQRNSGLDRVRSDVVMFPDDDSLWYPDYAASIMGIYERDPEELIGGIRGEEAKAPPGGLVPARLPYAMTFRGQAILRLSRPLRRLEFFAFMRNPIFLAGDDKTAGKKIPSWLGEAEAALSGPMSGFAMSFRTRSIAAHKFDETLGRYALFEDYDASLRIMEQQIIVKAKKALVFHFRSPERRTNGLEWGAITILNRAYVICKSSRPGSVARRNQVPYALYQCARYLAQCPTPYGWQRLKGALRALRHIRLLLDSPSERLPGALLSAREKCFL